MEWLAEAGENEGLPGLLSAKSLFRIEWPPVFKINHFLFEASLAFGSGARQAVLAGRSK